MLFLTIPLVKYYFFLSFTLEVNTNRYEKGKDYDYDDGNIQDNSRGV